MCTLPVPAARIHRSRGAANVASKACTMAGSTVSRPKPATTTSRGGTVTARAAAIALAILARRLRLAHLATRDRSLIHRASALCAAAARDACALRCQASRLRCSGGRGARARLPGLHPPTTRADSPPAPGASARAIERAPAQRCLIASSGAMRTEIMNTLPLQFPLVERPPVPHPLALTA